MSSEQITKVKLKDQGLAGLVVSYEKPTKREDFNYRDEYEVKHKASVHDDLKKKWDELKQHVINIGRLNADIADEEIRVTGVKSDGYESFQITYQVLTFGGAWCPASNTPKVTESLGYEGFDWCLELIRDVYNEVRAYIKAEKKLNYSQLALDLAHNDKKGGADVVETVQAMSEQERINYCRELLEEKGAIVMMQDEMSEGNQVESEEAEIEETPQEEIEVLAANEGSTSPVVTGFGAVQETGKVVSLQPEPAKDDVAAARKRARSMN